MNNYVVRQPVKDRDDQVIGNEVMFQLEMCIRDRIMYWDLFLRPLHSAGRSSSHYAS